MVMVDTGNSYEGLCEYLGGKYISYTEERPITMNPFRINREEYNIEKIDFLKNLILMIWKGSDSQIPEIEFRIVEQIIIDYYDAYFNGFTRYTDEQREVLLKNLFAAASRKNPNKPPREVDEMVRKQIEVLEARRAALKVSELNFNSFFDYSFDRLEQICTEMTSRQSATRPIRPCCSRSTRAVRMRKFSTRQWIRHCLTRHSSSLKWMQSRKTRNCFPLSH